MAIRNSHLPSYPSIPFPSRLLAPAPSPRLTPSPLSPDLSADPSLYLYQPEPIQSWAVLAIRRGKDYKRGEREDQMHIARDYKEDQEEECVNENKKTRRPALSM
ncbi:hypothetical protein E2C01_076276 [Portunus trituberculatus]|uniref:Uncharacterized protein n=1 Tax=Portunus trituberculatus TaxID=210409 RepID=A0A5B7ILL5_PORTR|nr:hypothetical protein [Portunus trituberculatus]